MPIQPDNIVYSTESPNFLPNEGLMEFIETTTVTKRWIYHKFPAKHKPKPEKSSKVIHAKFPSVEGLNKV